jgi:polyhydroxybutyrate depolymerase
VTTRRASTAIAVLVLMIMSACSSSGSTATDRAPATARHASGPSKGCGVKPAIPPGNSDRTITSGGVERRFQLDVPSSYDGTKPFAIVLGLHSLTVDYRVVPGMAFGDLASKYEFIGVAPSGRLDAGTPYWNAAPANDNYDVAFISDLLDELESTLCVDTGRVFSAGMSNGAQLSSLLGCRLPERISGIAPIAGVEFFPPCDGPPVPVIAFHGDADPIVPYTGGGLNATTIADTYYYKGKLPAGLPESHGVDESMRSWAKHNGCGARYKESRISPEVRRRVWPHCDAATELYIVDGGGHAWPGQRVPQFEAQFGHGTDDIDARALMFSFFFEPASRP